MVAPEQNLTMGGSLHRAESPIIARHRIEKAYSGSLRLFRCVSKILGFYRSKKKGLD